MEEKLRNLEEMMKTTVLDEVKFDKGLELKIKQELLRKGQSKRQWSPIKRWVVSVAAAVIIISSFIGAIHTSPAFAQTVAKIPLLKLMVHNEHPASIISVVEEELAKHNYNQVAVGLTVQPEKTLEIHFLGTKEYYEKVKDDVKKIAENLLASKELDAYEVRVIPPPENKPLTEEEIKRNGAAADLINYIQREMLKAGFDVISVGVGVKGYNQDGIINDGIFNVEIYDTETREEEMTQFIHELTTEKGINDLPIKFYKNKKEKYEQDSRWGNIVAILSVDVMGKEEYKGKGISYTVDPVPTIIIKTTVKTTGPEEKQFGNDLQKVIEEFLQTEDMSKLVKGDSYKIEIRSEDGNRLND